MAIGWKRLGLRGALLLISLHSLFPQAHPDGRVAGSLLIAANATAAGIYELTPHEVTSIAPVRGTEQLRMVGDIQPFQRATLRAKTEGRIVTLSAREGDTVRAGDTLVWFETSDLETEFRQREAEWEGAQAENRRALQTLRRLEQLATKNIATQDQLETAQNDVFVTGARVESAAAQRDMARAAIRDAAALEHLSTSPIPFGNGSHRFPAFASRSFRPVSGEELLRSSSAFWGAIRFCFSGSHRI
ncbi:efflux RND transporter periplasmic adaptor subunit [Aureimonas sp. AU20]|uniref:efflux RND transporter periplasmic adaptor subunit n=1 Tax=Aureimonas sp. AU20 TaxID=1349819 RepID=UPI00072182AF|nr:biotin/lipoyl-binding protein [Aureimonas sp. AU20]ALN71903.1 hypothetical protein M673_04185 [Aureimonas sp. AU20]